MFTRFAIVLASIVLFSSTAGQAQTPVEQPAASAPAKPKKAATKAKAAAKQPAVVESGPCRLGVISVIGDRFSVHKFGLTIFETEDSEVPIEGWGLDDLAVARVRAATGNDPGVRRISYPKGTFDLYYRPKSLFLREPNEDLPQIMRSITRNANCERYMVITKYKGTISGTKMETNGIGIYSQGIGPLARHAHLFANLRIQIFTGDTYQPINPSLSAIGSSLSQAFRLMEDPMKQLDHAHFPEPAEAASASPVLKERTRALLSAELDRVIPARLQE